MTRTRSDDGAVATEFALIAPLLILLFFGIFYFGLTVYRQSVVESATREAARVASVGGTAAEVEAALDTAAVGFASGETSVASATYCTSDAGNAVVNSTVTGGRFTFTVPFFGTVTPNFDTTATFRCERGP